MPTTNVKLSYHLVSLMYLSLVFGYLIPLLCIMETRLCNFDPLKPHFYIVKLGFTGVCISFLISAQKIYCGYSLEPPQRGGSNEYPQCMFWAEMWKMFLYLVVKFSINLNRRVYEMACPRHGRKIKYIDTHERAHSGNTISLLLFVC